mgnify:CR=1 FL=1
MAKHETLVEHLTKTKAIQLASDAASAAFGLQEKLNEVEDDLTKEEREHFSGMVGIMLSASAVYAQIAAGQVIDDKVFYDEDFWDDADSPSAVRGFVREQQDAADAADDD